VHCHHLRPLAAFTISTARNFFACGGLAYDIIIFKRLAIIPSFAPGIYYHGSGKNLGFPINFRSGIEVAYILGNQGRLGVQFNHISNAHMLYRNPGANSLFVYYAIPFPQKKASGK
jgi:lipid A 3-O-deacylase